jgi:hypothetical protein
MQQNDRSTQEQAEHDRKVAAATALLHMGPCRSHHKVEFVYLTLKSNAERAAFVRKMMKEHPYFREQPAVDCADWAQVKEVFKSFRLPMSDPCGVLPCGRTRGIAARMASLAISLFTQVSNGWPYMVVLEDDIAVPTNFRQKNLSCDRE